MRQQMLCTNYRLWAVLSGVVFLVLGSLTILPSVAKQGPDVTYWQVLGTMFGKIAKFGFPPGKLLAMIFWPLVWGVNPCDPKHPAGLDGPSNRRGLHDCCS